MHRDLVALLAEGISCGEFRAVDPDRFAARLRALLDGLAIQVAIGGNGADRAQALTHVGAFIDEALALTGGAPPYGDRVGCGRICRQGASERRR